MEKFLVEYAGTVYTNFVKGRSIDPLTLARLRTEIYWAGAIQRIFDDKKPLRYKLD
jgi:hypothetical protein